MPRYTYLEISRSREVLSILVEGDSHDTIGSVECFLYTIAMVNVNVNVQDTLMISVVEREREGERERERKKYRCEGRRRSMR